MQYRRALSPGGTFFFTVVTFNRQKIFTDERPISLLREAFRYLLKNHPMQIDAIVIMPDHLHTIWSLPDGDSDYPTRWRLIKSYFSHKWDPGLSPTTPSRLIKGEKYVWQRRYWEHQIRDEKDFARHVEYIHYNPVKHGLVNSPGEWEYSSFIRYVKDGIYPHDWGGGENIWEGENRME
jgi:putative transposase